MNYYSKCLKQYADFHGRARRAEFWYFVLFNSLVTFVISFVFTLLEVLLGGFGVIALVITYAYGLAIFIPSLAVCVRRLHDVGKSGWFYFICLIPIVGYIWLLVLFCTEGQQEANQWGENPKNLY